ncbi:MAG: DMT family transporter [Saprospiraceae bacterium]|nr:DMT family transporter [Saprospiraceae bacterium]
MNNNHYMKWILIIILGLIWGSSFILIKKGLEGFAYVEAASIRMMAAGVVSIIPAFFHLKRIPKDKYLVVFLTALFGMFFPAYLFCLAQVKVQSVVAGLLNALTPAFAFLIAILFYNTKFKNLHLAGLIIGLCSAILLSLERSSGNISFNSYSLFVVLATLSYGTNINVVKNHLQQVNSLSVSFVSVSIAGFLSFLIFFIPNMSAYAVSSSNIGAFLYLIILGVLGTALAQVLFNKLIQISSTIFAGSVTFLIPLVALIWGIIDGEVIGFSHFICILGILFSVYLIRKS